MSKTRAPYSGMPTETKMRPARLETYNINKINPAMVAWRTLQQIGLSNAANEEIKSMIAQKIDQAQYDLSSLKDELYQRAEIEL